MPAFRITLTKVKGIQWKNLRKIIQRGSSASFQSNRVSMPAFRVTNTKAKWTQWKSMKDCITGFPCQVSEKHIPKWRGPNGKINKRSHNTDPMPAFRATNTKAKWIQCQLSEKRIPKWREPKGKNRRNIASFWVTYTKSKGDSMEKSTKHRITGFYASFKSNVNQGK